MNYLTKKSLFPLIILLIGQLLGASANATSTDLIGDPYNVAFNLSTQGNNTQQLYSFWFGYGPESVVRTLDINGQTATLTLNGTVRIADVDIASGNKSYSYYESGAGSLSLTFSGIHEIQTGVYGGTAGTGTFSYNGSHTLNADITTIAATVPGISESSNFFFGNDLITGSVNSNNIFDFASWYTASNITINGSGTTNVFAKGNTLLSSPNANGTDIPEPATATLLGLSVIGASLKRKKHA